MTVARVVKSSIAAIVVLAALAQSIRPARTNPPVDPAIRIDAHLTVPADVRAIFDRSCRDCHSNETRWPAYSAIAPVSWWIVHDVNEGREELNWSEWGKYDRDEVGEKLKHLCSETREGHMPIPAYAWMHREARLSQADVERICAWANAERAKR